jgi:hypothetical protein
MECQGTSSVITQTYKDISINVVNLLVKFTEKWNTLITNVQICCGTTNGNYGSLIDLLDEFIANNKECCEAILKLLDEWDCLLACFPCLVQAELVTTTTTTLPVATTTTTVHIESTTTTVPVICDEPTTFRDKGAHYPAIFTKYIGTDLGIVTLGFQVYDIPDKIIVSWGGMEMMDTGYHGNPLFQDKLDTALLAEGDPVETIDPVQSGSEQH